MLVQHVLDFIKKLQNEKRAACDQTFLASLTTYFSSKTPNNELNQDDFSFLRNCYALRWNEVLSKKYAEYTRSNLGFNGKLIEFAAVLVKKMDLDLRSLLMPSVTNPIDPNDFSRLDDLTIANLTDFHVTDNLLLQRKASWLKYMKEHGCVLFTFQLNGDLYEKKPTSVYELKALKECNESIFWEQLRAEIFPSLTQAGKFSEEMLNRLSDLLTNYFTLKQSSEKCSEFQEQVLKQQKDETSSEFQERVLKQNKEKFSKFQEQVQKFFSTLSDFTIEQVNSLYGQKIKYQGKEAYLVDLLINLSAVTSFDLQLDKDMDLLLNVIGRSKDPQTKANEQLFATLVSILRFDFNLFRITGDYVFFWDTCNHVPHAVATLFSRIESLGFTSSTSKSVGKYADLLATLVVPPNPALSWWAWLTVNSELFRWVSEIKVAKNPSNVGGYWYEPSVIMAALMKLPISDEIRPKFYDFYDELIKTCAQDKIDLFKHKVRINIHFSKFVSQFSEPMRKDIVSLIESTPAHTAQEQFFNNCISYLKKCLKMKGDDLGDFSVGFFDPKNKAGEMHQLLDQYTKQIVQRYPTNPAESEGIKYLHDLKHSILTTRELLESKRDADGPYERRGPDINYN